VAATAPDPHPFICHRPEAWERGIATRWMDVDQAIRDRVDPNLEAMTLE